ncbi:hypothetical protein Leryth_024955 [Lithospermum erythrorhizon]|nr:hypothetical protein Leryth_024955 [Lithospermum erythrorhizon]
MAMDPDTVSKAFVEHYYTTFDTNRSGLAGLYQEQSMLSFEGQKIRKNILTNSYSNNANIRSPPLIVNLRDLLEECSSSFPGIFNSKANNTLSNSPSLCFLKSDFPFDIPFSFIMFHLIPTPQGSFYVFNDIFRLNYA